MRFLEEEKELIILRIAQANVCKRAALTVLVVIEKLKTVITLALFEPASAFMQLTPFSLLRRNCMKS